MDFWNAAFVFFAGVLAHMWGQRIFDRTRVFNVYKETFIKSFIILKYSVETCESLMSGVEDANPDKEGVLAAFQFWKRMAVESLKDCVPPEVSKSLGVKDWETAIKALERITKTGSKNEL
jgi:hypothetical protein